MAVGQVSSINQDNWQLIDTKTASTSASLAFTGLSGYKKYMLTWGQTGYLLFSTSTRIKLTFNGSSTLYAGGTNVAINNAYAGISTYKGASTYTYFYMGGLLSGGALAGHLEIQNPNLPIPKVLTGMYQNGDDYAEPMFGSWGDSASITSITLTPESGTFTSGAVKLYGIAE